MSVIHEALKSATDEKGQSQTPPAAPKPTEAKRLFVFFILSSIFAVTFFLLYLSERKMELDLAKELEVRTDQVADLERQVAELTEAKESSEEMLNTQIATLDGTIKDLNEKLLAVTEEKKSLEQTLEERDLQADELVASKAALERDLLKKDEALKALETKTAPSVSPKPKKA